MAEDNYIDLGFTAAADPEALRERALEKIGDGMGTDWVAPQAGLVWLQADATGELGADREQQALTIAESIWAEFGTTVHDLPIGTAQTAVGTTTWTVAGAPASGTIPAGTQVASGDVLFTVLSDVSFTGPTATVSGVAIEAVEEGLGGNVAAGPVDVLMALGYTVTVAIDVPGTSGGAEAETIDAYMNRLRLHVAHAGRPTLPADFSARLRDYLPTAARVLAVDLYDATTSTAGVEKHITLVPVDAAGEPIPSGDRGVAQSLLDAEREPNFVVHVVDPTYTTINASASITVWPGWDATAVRGQAEAAVRRWLAPGRWGQPPVGESSEWYSEPTVLRSELSAVINQVEGVRVVTLPKLASGAGTPADADVSLSGIAALTRPGLITVV